MLSWDLFLISFCYGYPEKEKEAWETQSCRLGGYDMYINTENNRIRKITKCV